MRTKSWVHHGLIRSKFFVQRTPSDNMKSSRHSNKSSSFLISTVFMSILWVVEGNLYPAIEWNPLNPIFKTSNQSVVQFNVTMKSQMNIICPNVASNLIYLESAIEKDYLYENLWFVDKKSFETCQVNTTHKHNLLLYKCDDPISLKYRKLTFKPISPVKGEPEFQKGKEYYFMASSNGSEVSLDNKGMGHCKTHNMRFKVYICVDKNDWRCKAKQPEEPKTTSSTPTNKKDIKSDLQGGNPGKSVKECFLTSRDKVWLIATGAIVGILLILLLGSLAFTCVKRKRSSYDDQDGKIPLNEKVENNRV